MDEPRNLDHLLAQVKRLHDKRGHRRFSGKKFHPRQYPLLMMLSENDGQTHSELAERMCVSPPTVSKGVQRLEARGLLERRSDPRDERVSRVFITEEGKQARQTMEGVLDEMNDDLSNVLDAEERAELVGLLMKLRNYFESQLEK